MRVSGARSFLVAAGCAAVGTPMLFFLRFGTLDRFGWSATVFLVVLCLLIAFGYHLAPRRDLHTRVPLHGGRLDKIGAGWLVGCAFGPFSGWIATSGTIPITESSWRWLYGVRIVLAVVVPVVLGVPLLRYARGKATRIALPLLLGVTALPVLTGVNTARDLWSGPAYRPAAAHIGPPDYLRHTHRTLSHEAYSVRSGPSR
jgi:MFS family permease